MVEQFCPNLNDDDFSRDNSGCELAAVDSLYTSVEARTDLLYDNSPKGYGNLVRNTDTRTVFQHDRDAIIHSKSFRRLMHKTQVTYPGNYKDEHTRTRLTHTLEVMQIARGLVVDLRLNEDLAEAIALGHDLGHTPFGHEGEQFLDDVCCETEVKGNSAPSIKKKYDLPSFKFEFKHNYQSVRVLMCWEGTHRDKETKATARGLNISKQTLEGILKHSRIWRKGTKNPYKYPEIIEMGDFFQLDKEYAVWSVEGQIVALADEIAQVCHDLDDAISTEYSIKHILYSKLEEFLNDPEHGEYYEVLKTQPFIHHKNKYEGDLRERITVDKNDFGSFLSWVIGYFRLYSQDKIREEMREYVKTKYAHNHSLFPLPS